MHSEFTFHKLNALGIKRAQKIARAFDDLLSDLTTSDANASPPCPPSRETSIMKTKLEEACFFAKKAMASQQANQEAPEPEGPPGSTPAGVGG